MTDAELFDIARTVLPTRLQTAPMQVLRASGALAHMAIQNEAGHDEEGQLRKEFAEILKFELPSDEQSDVEEVLVTEHTKEGPRVTIVHIHDGVARRVITQA